jgi:tetratricopeptide (TPR) repeat protein
LLLLVGGMLVFGALFPRVANGQRQGERWYGAGVHQYFRGCQHEAINSLNQSIAENPNDPRAYYFRGLAQMALGDSYSAQADFQQGAFVEAQTGRRSSIVNTALERIQGYLRIEIERARNDARLARQYQNANPVVIAEPQPPAVETLRPAVEFTTERNAVVPGREQPVQPLVDSARSETLDAMAAETPPAFEPGPDPNVTAVIEPAGSNSILERPEPNPFGQNPSALDSRPAESERVTLQDVPTTGSEAQSNNILPSEIEPRDSEAFNDQPVDLQPHEVESGNESPTESTANISGRKVFRGLIGAFANAAKNRVEKLAESASNATAASLPTQRGNNELPPSGIEPAGNGAFDDSVFGGEPGEGNQPFEPPAGDGAENPFSDAPTDEAAGNPFADDPADDEAGDPADDDTDESANDDPADDSNGEQSSDDPFGGG